MDRKEEDRASAERAANRLADLAGASEPPRIVGSGDTCNRWAFKDRDGRRTVLLHRNCYAGVLFPVFLRDGLLEGVKADIVLAGFTMPDGTLLVAGWFDGVPGTISRTREPSPDRPDDINDPGRYFSRDVMEVL